MGVQPPAPDRRVIIVIIVIIVISSINGTCTALWWLYVAPVSLSLQMTTTPATGRP